MLLGAAIFTIINFDMHDSSKCTFSKKFSESLFILASSFHSSKLTSFKKIETVLQPVTFMTKPALDTWLWNWIYLLTFVITSVIFFFGPFASFLNLLL